MNEVEVLKRENAVLKAQIEEFNNTIDAIMTILMLRSRESCAVSYIKNDDERLNIVESMYNIK